MICGKCNFDNPAGFKFCGSCGNPLALICPVCKTELPDGFKFCGSCGTPLDSKSAEAKQPEQIKTKDAEIRNVTVLFSDVSGFTSMSEKLDPEEVREIMNECFEKFTKIIYKYEGTVDKFIGDAIMALFGAPIAHENDPERAIRAALDMQETLRDFSYKLKGKSGFELKMRIGINTGQVVAGSVGSDLRSDYTVMGDTVNLASRLEHASPVGGILISDTTYYHVGSLFEFEELSPITVKGKEKPVNVYMVKGLAAKESEPAEATTLKSPMISRDRELNLLRKFSKMLTKQKKPSCVLITGEAGIGKDRLVEEFYQEVQSDVRILRGRALTYARSGGYWIYLEVLRDYFGIKDYDDDDEVETKLTNKINSLKCLNVLPYIGYLFSNQRIIEKYQSKLKFLTPEQLREQIFLSIRTFLFSAAEKERLLIFLNDFQAADELSIDLTGFIVENLVSVPIMICICSRPAERKNLSELFVSLDKLKTLETAVVELDKLPMEQSKRMFKNILPPKVNVPKSIIDLVIEKSDGIPFFIEEITKMFIDRGYFKKTEGKLNIEQVDISNIQVPGNIQSLMMSRFDLLNERDKIVSQDSSVIGRTYPYDMLKELVSDELPENDIDPAVRELEKAEIIQLLSSNGDREYGFKSAIMHETIYNTILKKKRSILHGKIGRYLERKHSNRIQELYEIIAHHFNHSEYKDEALRYLIKAADKAKEQYANSQALKYYEQALALIRTLPEDDTVSLQIQINISMADIYVLTGEYDKALHYYDNAVEITKFTGSDPAMLAEIYQLKGNVYSYMNDFQKATNFLKRAEKEAAKEKGKDMGLVFIRIYDAYGWVYYNQGMFNKARDACNKALSLLIRIDSLGDLGRAYNLMGVINFSAGNWDSALEYFEKSRAICEEINNFRGVSACLNNIALIQSNRGKFEESLKYHEKSLDIAKRIGDRLGIAVQLNNIGSVYCAYNDFISAKKYLEEAFEEAKDVAPQDFLAEINCYLSQTHIGLDELDAASALIEDTIEILQKIDSPYYFALALRIKGEILQKKGSLLNASQHYRESLEIFEEIQAECEIGITSKMLSELFHQMQDQGIECSEKQIKALVSKYKSIYDKLGIKT